MATSQPDEVGLIQSSDSEEDKHKKRRKKNPGRSWNRYAAEGYNIIHNNNQPKNFQIEDESQSRTSTRTERQLYGLLFFSLFVVVALIIALIFVSYRSTNVDTCQSPECIVLAGKIMSKMDLSHDPCDNFFQYSCAGFLKNANIPPSSTKYGTFKEVGERNEMVVMKELDKPGSLYKGVNSTAIEKARAYYRTCMNITAVEDISPDRLKEVIKDLGSWPLVDDAVSGHWDESTWNIEQTLARSYWYAQNPLFVMGVGMDLKNNTIQKIEFEQGGTTFSNPENYFGNDTQLYHDLYMKLVSKTVELLGNTNNVSADVEDMWQLEVAMAKAFDTPEEMSDQAARYNSLIVDDVQDMFGSAMDVKDYLSRAMGSNIPGNEHVLVFAPKYLKKLSPLMLAATPRILANYVVWQTVLSFLSVMPTQFRLVLEEVQDTLSGTSGSGELWKSCVQATNAKLGFATGALFIENVGFTEKQKSNIEHLLTNIREQFITRLPNVPWMDEETSERAIDKAETIDKKIGYPDFIMDPKSLDEFYEKLEVTENDPFKNQLSSRTFVIQKEVEKRGNPPDKTLWSMYPSMVNAYYNPLFNEMVFPAGILQAPFYDKDLPWSAVYGAIGMVMGHELTHAFDNNGRQYDKFGNLNNWWTNQSATAFLEKTKCLIDQYSQYTVQGEHVNGITTLGENIADNNGLDIAYNAFKNWAKSTNYREQPLPGLNMTSDQLFFLSFSQLWCAHYTPEYALESLVLDEHTFAKYRIIGTLSNNEAFAEAYKCPVDSPMNPSHKCDVW